MYYIFLSRIFLILIWNIYTVVKKKKTIFNKRTRKTTSVHQIDIENVNFAEKLRNEKFFRSKKKMTLMKHRSAASSEFLFFPFDINGSEARDFDRIFRDFPRFPYYYINNALAWRGSIMGVIFIDRIGKHFWEKATCKFSDDSPITNYAFRALIWCRKAVFRTTVITY